MIARHSKAVCDAWGEFYINVWPGADVIGDRKLISDFTGMDEDDLGGFPVNSPDCMVLDQSVTNIFHVEKQSWRLILDLW